MNLNNRQTQQSLIIGLTQTEIMFVFASLIILLLLTSLDRLGKVETERDVISAALDNPNKYTELAEENRQLRLQLVDPEAAEQELTTATAELAQTMDRNPDTPLPQLLSQANEKLQQAADNGSALSEQNQQPAGNAANPDAPLDALLQQSSVDKSTPTPPASNPKFGQSDNPAQLQRELAQLQQQNDELSSQLAKNQNIIQQQRVKLIGFLPCWPRGETGHYFTYKADYRSSDNSYRLEPIWDNSVGQIQQDLNGPLSILFSYPQSWVSASELASFGKQIELNRAAHYRNNCKFSVQLINLEADGNVIKFLRDNVGLYPILR